MKVIFLYPLINLEYKKIQTGNTFPDMEYNKIL